MAALAKATPIVIDPVSNDSARTIQFEEPYAVRVEVTGTSALLFHRWSIEGIEDKANSAKGSKAKKTDDIESYVFRTASGVISIPTEYFRQAIIHAAKYKQDPRSPRKSAMDLFKASIVGLEELCPLGKAKTWDFVHRCRVTIQRNGITRSRPAMNAGWKTEMRLQVLLPEYVSPALLNEVLQSAGKLVGVGDFRPTYGRFQVTSFSVCKG